MLMELVELEVSAGLAAARVAEATRRRCLSWTILMVGGRYTPGELRGVRSSSLEEKLNEGASCLWRWRHQPGTASL